MVSKRKQKKSSVSAKDIKQYAEKSNSVRISYHEKVCAERMKTLFLFTIPLSILFISSIDRR